MRIQELTKEQLSEAIDNSISIREVLLYLNFGLGSGNYTAINNKAKYETHLSGTK